MHAHTRQIQVDSGCGQAAPGVRRPAPPQGRRDQRWAAPSAAARSSPAASSISMPSCSAPSPSCQAGRQGEGGWLRGAEVGAAGGCWRGEGGSWSGSVARLHVNASPASQPTPPSCSRTRATQEQAQQANEQGASWPAGSQSARQRPAAGPAAGQRAGPERAGPHQPPSPPRQAPCFRPAAPAPPACRCAS